MVRGEVGGGSFAGDVDVAFRIEGDAVAGFSGATAVVGREGEGTALGVELGYEGVAGATQVLLHRPGGGEVGGFGVADDVDVAGSVHSDARSFITTGTAEVRGIFQSLACGFKLGYERVDTAWL